MRQATIHPSNYLSTIQWCQAASAYLVARDGLGVASLLLEGAMPVLPVLEALLHDVHDVVPMVKLGRAVVGVRA